MLTRLFVAVLMALSGSVAAGLAGPTVLATATAEEPEGSILVIMDVSGSMERRDGSGTTLIAGARQAVRSLVDKAPADTRVGLRLYGHSYPGDDQSRGCRDSELVVPIGPVSITGDRIGAAISRTRPTGFTPIGHSLREAAGDFPPDGERTIVLVSDGEDTCGTPEPCQAARQLRAQGVAVRVDTVGLFLRDNARARRQLQCVARAAGGRYYAAENADQLTAQLTAVSQRAIQRFQASGGQIDGGPAAPRAAAVEAGAAYVDDVRPGEARWYSFEAARGQVARVTLTEDGATEYGCCLKVRVLDPGVDQLDYENSFNGDGTATTLRLETDDQGLRETGAHYVEVVLDENAANRAVNYEFTVEVAGETFDVAPSPTASPTSTLEASASAVPSPTREAPAQEETASPETEPQAAATDEGGDGLLWLVVAFLLVAVLLVSGLLVFLFTRLGRSGPGGPGASR